LIPKDLKSLDRPPRRIMEVLLKGGNSSVSEAPRSWSLDFCMSPTSFNPDQTNEDKLGSVAFEKTSLEPSPFDRNAKAIGTRETIHLPASLAMRSIGYKSEALPGFDSLKIPFDNTKGVIPNDFLGRVVDNPKDWLQSAKATPMPGMYCAGWVKRGPTGVIASTMDDAFSTASSIVMDWEENKPFLNPDGSTGLGWEGVKAGAAERNLRRISWEDWKRIDAVEKENGRKVGKEREKFTSISKMLAVLD
jgi:adrenodoxin-NADP+ reductase